MADAPGTAVVPSEGMLIGYARVSTEEQNLNMQIDALKKAGVEPERIYQESVSGTRTNRPQFLECIKTLRPGDTLVVWRLDRVGRSLPHLISVMGDLEKRGIGFRSLTELIDTKTAGGRLIFHVFAAVAQFERDLISERTKAGLKSARARGHRGGRKSKITEHMMKAARAMLADPTVTMDDVSKTIGVSRAAIYRAFERAKEADQMKALRKAAKVAKRATRTVLT